MNQLTRDLYIGAHDEAPQGMTAFCLSPRLKDLPCEACPDCSLEDVPGNPVEDVAEAVIKLDHVLTFASPVFLCCRKGISRSPYVASLWIAWILDAPFWWTVYYVKAKHPPADIHPIHLEQAERVLEVLRA